MSKREPEDGLLDAYLSGMDSDGIPITLFVGGSMITGKAVPASTYMKSVWGHFEPETRTAEWIASREQQENEVRALEDKNPEEFTRSEYKLVYQRRSFINLLDAHFTLGTGQLVPTNAPMAVRIRISAVDGWTNASMSTD